ncbi:M20 family metallopeptidase [Patescibacteria group bacterium]|nr:M20 family metallopeptidase [Patescibacteria group bacterium]
MSLYVDQLLKQQDAMTTMLRDMVEMESPSDDKQALYRLTRYMADRFSQIGAAVEFVQPDAGDHLRASWGSGDEQVLVLCHLDTVWPAGELSRRPFRVEGGRAYGPGVYDMKGGVVQAFFALKAIIELSIRPDRKIVFLCNTDEETGSLSSRALIEQEALRSRFVLVPEPASGANGAVKLTRKGWGIYHLTVTGRTAHAGSDHEKGISAVTELAYQILKLQALTDYSTGTTINVGVISGGTVFNVVPDKAEARIDLRAASHDELQKTQQAILGLASVTQGAILKVTGRINRPPLEATDRNMQLYRRAKQIAADLGIELPGVHVGSVSDGNFTSSVGAVTLDGIGAVGDGAHAVHEYLELKAMAPRAALFARLLAEL